MPKSRPHHHELPRFYLRGFTGASTPSFVWTFERGAAYSPGTKYGNNPRRLGLSEAGLRPDGYEAVTRSGKRHFDYEQALQKQERLADGVIQRVRAFEQLNGDDKGVLARYIALMWRRVSAQDPMIASLVERHFDISGLNATARQYADAGMFYDARKLFEEADWYRSERGRLELQRDMLLSSFDQFRSVLMGLHWVFYRAPESVHFITSDVPVAYDRAVGVKASPLHFALSRNVLLVATYTGEADLTWQDADSAAVEAFNTTLLSYASRIAYSPARDEWIQLVFR